MAKYHIPMHNRTVIKSLKVAREAAEEKLKTPPQEAPAREIPSTFPGKVGVQLLQAIQNAQKEAEKCKNKDPNTRMYIHYEAFPQELYDGLEKKYLSLKEELESQGFEFYMTSNFGANNHPMVKFTLKF